MFNSKRKEDAKRLDEMSAKLKAYSNNYKDWAEDMGFLNLIMSRKIEIVKEYYIVPMVETQLDKNSYIRDKDINDMYEDAVTQTMASMSKEYVDYLTGKYFSGYESLVEFVSENVYTEIVKASVAANARKVGASISPKDRKDISASLAEKRKKIAEAVASNISAKKVDDK